MESFIYDMDLAEAQTTVKQMANERGVKGSVIIDEYLKYRDDKTLVASHFWPNQNSACFKIVSELDRLEA